MYGPRKLPLRGALWPIPRSACCRESGCCGRAGLPERGSSRAISFFPGLLLAALVAALALRVPRGSVDAPGGLGFLVLAEAAALAGLIAMTVRALRLKASELRRTVYQVTDRRVLITTGTRDAWAAYLDQLGEPVVVPQRDRTADLTLRASDKFSLSTLANGQQSSRAVLPGVQSPFLVLRGLPDAELARQVISTGRQRMLRGALDASS